MSPITVLGIISGICWLPMLAVGIWGVIGENDQLRWIIVMSLVSLFVAVFFTGLTILGLDYLLIKTVEKESFLLSTEKEIKTVFQESIKFWKWDDLFDNAKLISYRPRSLCVEINGPRTITQNPKVRDLKYWVMVEYSGSPELYLQYTQFEGKSLKYWLYELNEQKSKDFAQFYNPEDDDQQERFKKFVGDFLRPHLKKRSLRFDSARFSLL